MCNLPSVGREDLVVLLATLLAEIFVWGRLGAEDANAGSVLPDLANIALNEESSNVFSEFMCEKELGLWGVGGRRPGVVLGAADASNGLVLLILQVLASENYFHVIV